MSGTRAISTTSRRELSSSIFFFLQGKTPKEIYAILTEISACFLPGRAKDLSAPLYRLKQQVQYLRKKKEYQMLYSDLTKFFSNINLTTQRRATQPNGMVPPIVMNLHPS